MNRQRILSVAACFVTAWSCVAIAADVDVRLSSREAYVGAPILLQIDITNASNYEAPAVPEIDGVEIRSAGAPSHTSQTTIFSGRLSVTQRDSLRYQLIPTRAGSFEIPPLMIKVDGREVTTKPLAFLATKSETGDLLFVEVEGKKGSVYVGQPLELVLKIWIKPYRNLEHGVTLSELNMWQLISKGTSWGSFSDRVRELAASNQRPKGDEVLREDGEGNQRSYYLYEIDATVYPTHPGKIDASDVRVVVNYPTELGVQRGRRGRIFGDDAFGNSPLSQLLDDDFFGAAFGGSGFNDYLAVTKDRPIIADAKVNPTEVSPVPTDSRPADYRGTVGMYQIYTQIDVGSVKAGDPIQLDIGITGTGPMQLVQAPPLSEIKRLTDDFKVSDQPLAGFARGNTKLFSTAIRPRREGITEIPPIPLSFFNPETASFETVMSEPISITVGKADSLSLDSIVSTTLPSASQSNPPVVSVLQPNFVNDDSKSVLFNQSPIDHNRWWLSLVIVPPILWLVTVAYWQGRKLFRWLPSFRSAGQRCVAVIAAANSSEEILHALQQFIGGDRGQIQSAVGTLRLEGLYPQAAELESFVDQVQRHLSDDVAPETLQSCRATAIELMQRIETTRLTRTKSLVRRRERGAGTSHLPNASQKALLILTLVGMQLAHHSAAADVGLVLDSTQQQTLLDEASSDYAKAIEASTTNAAEANESFTAAATKYQRLVDSGVTNGRLYFNLGNAYLQSGELGRAIANYERTRMLEPMNRQLAVNLKYARDKVHTNGSVDPSETATVASVFAVMRNISLACYNVIIGTLMVSSLAFWILAIIRTMNFSFPFWRFAALPLVVLLASLSLAGFVAYPSDSSDRGVIITDRVILRTGDGADFDPVATLDSAEGQLLDVLVVRGVWAKVQTSLGQVGWIQCQSIELLKQVGTSHSV